MNKKLILSLCAGLCATLNAFAQQDLLYGAPKEHIIVKKPYIFWDLMRDHLPSWIRYYRNDAAAPFVPYSRYIQKKDTSGRFNHLEISNWDTIQNKWDLYDKHLHQKSFVNGKVMSEFEETWYSEPQVYRNFVCNYVYENNKLIKYNYSVRNESQELSKGETFITYNNLNQRIYDSSEVLNSRYDRYIEYHQYNSNNQCVFSKNHINGDLFYSMGYNYQNGLLTQVVFYSTLVPDTIVNHKTNYTYNSSGKLTHALLYFRNPENNTLNETIVYKHGYTETGRLKWMCSYDWKNDKWMKSDSVVITYTNNNVDTSYSYLANTNNEWLTSPNFMFVFDEQMVGINTIKNHSIDFSVFPNPANNHVSINIDATDKINHVSITDILGKVVYEKEFYSDDIDVKTWYPGIYFITITTNKGIGYKKIIIE